MENNKDNTPKTLAEKPAAPENKVAPEKSAAPANKAAPAKNATYRALAAANVPVSPVLPADTEAGEEKRRRVAFWIIVTVTFLIVAAFAVYLFFFQGKTEAPVQENVHTVRVDGVNMYDPSTALSSLKAKTADSVKYPDGIQEKFKAAYAANQHFVGWVSVPNTSIDAAVYQTDNNNTYLKGDLWGRWSRYGTIFLDAYSNAKDLRRNSVIYGHNFDDDQDKEFDDYIFGDLHKYLDVDFYRTAPVVEFDTLYHDYKWKVIGCFLTNGEGGGDNGYLFYYIATGMNNDNFMSFIDNVKQRSYINTTVDVQPDDKLLTLSTCTYEFDKNGGLHDARCVLIARLVREGESEDVDVSGATQNENPRMPQMYYNVYGGSNPFRNAERWYPAE